MNWFNQFPSISHSFWDNLNSYIFPVKTCTYTKSTILNRMIHPSLTLFEICGTIIFFYRNSVHIVNESFLIKWISHFSSICYRFLVSFIFHCKFVLLLNLPFYIEWTNQLSSVSYRFWDMWNILMVFTQT